MDSLTKSPRFNELLTKIDSVLLDNPKWMDDYFSILKDDEPIYNQLYFDKRFGLSEAEFKEFLALEKEQKIISSGKSELEIVKNDVSKVISFNSSEELELLDDLRIDLRNKKIYYKNIELEVFTEFSTSKNESMLKSNQKGYYWSSIDNETISGLADKKEYNLVHIIFEISQLEENGKFYISIYQSDLNSEIICSDLPSFKELCIML